MYVVRNVFRAKPGKAKEVVTKFKAASPHFRAMGFGDTRILTDAVAGFWTVVVETHVEDLGVYQKLVETRPSNPELEQTMAGYMDLVETGHREIFRVE
jgi:hypothetical protein